MRPDTLRPANRGDACRIQSGGVACQFVALRMATADEKGSDIDQTVRLQRGALVLPTIFSKSDKWAGPLPGVTPRVIG